MTQFEKGTQNNCLLDPSLLEGDGAEQDDTDRRMRKWDQFVKLIQKMNNERLDIQLLKNVIKLKEKQFPSNNFIINYYRSEFAMQIYLQDYQNYQENFINQSKQMAQTRQTFIDLVCSPASSLEQQDNHMPCKNQNNQSCQNDEDWNSLSEILGVSPNLLNLKWLSLLKTTLKEYPWSSQEDQHLNDIMMISQNNYQKDWTKIAIQFNKQNNQKYNRYAKQIRERWNNFINPEIAKKDWDMKEKIMIFKSLKVFGKRWSKISKQLKGRTENQVKNQYNSILKYFKKKLHLADKDIIEIISQSTEDTNSLDDIIQEYLQKIQEDKKLDELEGIKTKKLKQESLKIQSGKLYVKQDNQTYQNQVQFNYFPLPYSLYQQFYLNQVFQHHFYFIVALFLTFYLVSSYILSSRL